MCDIPKVVQKPVNLAEALESFHLFAEAMRQIDARQARFLAPVGAQHTGAPSPAPLQSLREVLVETGEIESTPSEGL